MFSIAPVKKHFRQVGLSVPGNLRRQASASPHSSGPSGQMNIYSQAAQNDCNEITDEGNSPNPSDDSNGALDIPAAHETRVVKA